MAEVISETDAKVYAYLRDNPSVRMTTADLATLAGVGIRAVQKRLTRLSGVIETLSTKPPRHRIMVQGRAGKMLAKRLDDAAEAYGIKKEGRTGT